MIFFYLLIINLLIYLNNLASAKLLLSIIFIYHKELKFERTIFSQIFDLIDIVKMLINLVNWALIFFESDI